jgi:hypothetical protein
MTSILYYSNYCEPSKQLLTQLAKTSLQEEVHFICIDKRSQEADGRVSLTLENNQRVVLPPTVTKVPALLLLTQGHRVLFADEIYAHFRPKEVATTQVATGGNGEPEAYSVNQIGTMSDAYSYVDQNAESLSAKGDGGTRQMHNFVSLGAEDFIATPPDNYEPDKVGNNGSVSLEQYKADRDLAAPLTPARL